MREGLTMEVMFDKHSQKNEGALGYVEERASHIDIMYQV